MTLLDKLITQANAIRGLDKNLDNKTELILLVDLNVKRKLLDEVYAKGYSPASSMLKDVQNDTITIGPYTIKFYMVLPEKNKETFMLLERRLRFEL